MKNIIWRNPTFASIALLLSLSAFRPLQAQPMTMPVDLSYLTQRADIIVQGKVISVEPEKAPGYQNIATVVITLEVENMLRGPSKKSSYTFREIILGPWGKGSMGAKGAKQNYFIGHRMLLFLLSPSSLGFSSPIGMGQGRFHVKRDASGAQTIVNEFGNTGLFKNVAQKASAGGRKLTSEQLHLVSTQQGPVQLNDFISLTKRLIMLPRIQ